MKDALPARTLLRGVLLLWGFIAGVRLLERVARRR